jgi:1-acyl-sn-glycerol-3-phosphate acyltransferase
MTVAFVCMPKLIIIFGTFVLTGCLIRMCLLFSDPNKPLSPLKRKIVTTISRVSAVINLLIANAYWLSHKKPKVDYSKYLGPSWKLSYERPSTIVMNHSSYLDIFIGIILKAPSFMAKEGVKNWPAVSAHG